MAYLFLKTSDSHEHRANPVWYAIDESKIETLAVSSSYDQYGQRISSSDAGDYLSLDDSGAVQFANDVYNEQEGNNDDERENLFKVGQNILAFDNSQLFDALADETALGITTYRTEFSGFNYWDGHNWKTVSLDGWDTDSSTHTIETDETIIARLNEAIENKEWDRDEPGMEIYRFKDAEITDSAWQGTWEEYSITLDNDFEDGE